MKVNHLKKSKKAQTWSLDLIIAVVLFVIVVGVFYAFLTVDNETDSVATLETGAKTIARSLTDTKNSGFLIDGDIHPQLLDSFTKKDYPVLQNDFGIVGDFCIYLENTQGNLVPFEIDGELQRGMGSNVLILSTDSEGNPIYCGSLKED